MARAIIRNGRITKITVNPNLGIEVGVIPRGVGFERLRWDGSKLIDLYELSEFYVDRATKSLHINPAPGRDLVEMEYKDRKKLVYDPKIEKIRLKTQAEIDKPMKERYKLRRRKEYPDIGDQMDVLWKFINNLPNKTQDVDDLLSKINEVKNRWPKPEEL